METRLMEFVILGKYLLPGGGQVLEHTGLAIKGGIIAAVDDNQSLLRDYPQYTVLDRTDAVISPGFVNAHMHAYGLLSHGITPPGTIDNFEAFLSDFWWPLVEDRIDFPMIIASGRAAALELVNSGVTAFCDVLEAPYAVPGGLKTLAGVIEETGMRAVLSFEASERVSREQGNAGLEENRQFFLEYRDHPLISGMMCIHTTFTCSPDYIRKAAAIAREIGSGIQMHLSESRYEPEWCRKTYNGKLPVELYEELAYLGPDVLASQGVKLTRGEIELLRQRGVRLVHVPLSNCEVGGGFSPVPELIEKGITVGLGTDGYINNFFEVMRGAFLLHKAHLENPEIMPAGTVYAMATEKGAAAAGIDGGGTLKAGGKADVITIKADLPTPITTSNIFSQLILYRNPEQVLDVWVAGRKLKADGKLIGFDLDAVRDEARFQAERLWRGI